MKFQGLIALAFSLTATSLPTDQIHEKRCPSKWCPAVREQVYYPTDFDEHNCPDLTAKSNVFAGHFDIGKPDNDHDDALKKRSVVSSSPSDNKLALAPRNRPERPICNLIAQNNAIRDFQGHSGDTAMIVLRAGITYVLSWAFDTAVEQVAMWREDAAAGGWTRMMYANRNDEAGTWEFTMPNGQDVEVHFQVYFAVWGFAHELYIRGQIALFELHEAFSG